MKESEKQKLKKGVGTYIRGKKMTLIIGARFKDGIILVSDRKVTNSDGEKPTYEEKLQTPLNFSVVFGAAGYSHKFKQFNRTILDLVDQRIREFKVKNRAYYENNGLEYVEEVVEPTKIERLTTKEIETEGNASENSSNTTPDVFLYTHELFIKDCSDLNRQLCIGKDEIARPDLDVIVGIHSRNQARVHHLDFLGEEQEVEYCAIGSGSPFVRMLLRRFWRDDMSIDQIISLCFFCMYYVQDLELENGVGMEEGRFPDHQVVTHDGILGVWTEIDKRKDEILSQTRKKVTLFKKALDGLTF